MAYCCDCLLIFILELLHNLVTHLIMHETPHDPKERTFTVEPSLQPSRCLTYKIRAYTAQARPGYISIMSTSLPFSDAFRQALRAESPDSAPQVDISTERKHNLGHEVLFSRKFIISYNLFLLAFLCFATSWHFAEKAMRMRKREKVAKESTQEPATEGQIEATPPPRAGGDISASSSSSSSSSTLETSATPPELAKERGNPDETTSLLQHATPASRTSPSHLIRSWLMYQPRNIPIVNKTLPSNATSLALLLFLGYNIFYLLYHVPLTVSSAFVLGDRAGLLFAANLPLLYLMAAKNQPIKSLTGYSYESLNIIHRRLGEIMAFLALLHFAAMVVVWYTLLSPRLSFWRFIAIKIIWLGLLALVAYQTLYLTSLGSFRQRFYELFLGIHIVFQVAGLVLLFLHHSGSRPYVAIALGIFVLDRLVFRTFLKTTSLDADLTIMDDGETILLSSNWSIADNTRWWQNNMHIKHGWKPTEHVFLTVSALSRKHFIQAHPFTIASAAPVAPNTSHLPEAERDPAQHAWLNFIIRARDGFSRDLLRYAQSHPSARVRVDGPYGSTHALEMLRDSDNAVVVAGGSGIAVAYPLIWDLLFNTDAGAHRGRRVSLIWVVHDSTHVEWIGQERLAELRERGLFLVIPPPTRKAGRPDLDGLLSWALTGHCQVNGRSTGVVVSGPDSMNRDVRNACAQLVRQGLDVSVSVEKFGW